MSTTTGEAEKQAEVAGIRARRRARVAWAFLSPALLVTAFVALAIETDVLERKREFERVPVLRNLVPIQVLMGRSSFNAGSSISAGLPEYSRNRLKAVAAELQKG